MPKRQKISITTDAVIISKVEGKTAILLIQRKNEPFKNQWALPGGFLESDETLETGAKRELKEETGLQIKALKQIGVFDAVDRDPRGRTISVAFLGIVKSKPIVRGADDAKDAKWFLIDELPELAFDHLEIVSGALDISKLID